MPAQLESSPLLLAAIALGVLGALLVLFAFGALLRMRPLRFVLRLLAGLLFLSLAALSAAIAVGVQGYHALTREDIAARVLVKPSGLQRIAAVFRFPDGSEKSFEIAGDEIYVDAHILKWTPLANLLGLHTAYELDRVAGRYHDIEQERTAARTVHALGEPRPVDLFSLRRRYSMLAPLLDAEYGSATFVKVTRPAELELRISPSGLLMREAGAVAPR